MIYSHRNGIFLKNEFEMPILIRVSNIDGRVMLEKIFVKFTEKPIFTSKAGVYYVEIEGEKKVNKKVVLY